MNELEKIARTIAGCDLPECICWHEHLDNASEVLNAPAGGDFSKESYFLIPKIEALQERKP